MMKMQNDYRNEYMNTLNRIFAEMKTLSEYKYFMDTAFFWANDKAGQKPKIVILGTGIPEELVIASGAVPYWITGGSLSAIAWSEECVPRDTDPVSRSMLGFIRQPDGADFSDALFLIPMNCDSMRKIAYQLKSEGRKIHVIDIPPDQHEPGSAEKWMRQIHSMIEAITNHLKTRITRGRILSAAKQVSEARQAMLSFQMITRDCPDIISDAAKILVYNSYYYTSDIQTWTNRLNALNTKITELKAQRTRQNPYQPKVLILGSPVLFPNYKIPFLMQEIGLHISAAIDSAYLKQYLLHHDQHGSCSSMIDKIALSWYDRDASSAFVRNDALFHYIAWLVKQGGIDGIVYHVLKGQIEFDFELERFETLFAEYGIPVFRLETDYQYQDAEQLRIRMEAFAEMLRQNRYKEVNRPCRNEQELSER